MSQVPKANKSSDASAASGTSLSTSATSATAPAAALRASVAPAASSTAKKLPDTPSREHISSAPLPPANASSNGNGSGSVAPPVAPHPRASVDSTVSQRSSSELGSKSPEASSLRRLHNIASPGPANSLPVPPPSEQAPSSAATVRQVPEQSRPVERTDRAARSAVTPQQPAQSQAPSSHAHASSLPVPQQLEVSFDRSVDAASSVHRSRTGFGAANEFSGASKQQPVNNGSAVPSTGHDLSEASTHGSAQKVRRSHAYSDQRHHDHHTTQVHSHSHTQPAAEDTEPFAGLRQALKPVTVRDLDESLQLLRYDIHREVQDVVREQIRQFSIAKVCFYECCIFRTVVLVCACKYLTMKLLALVSILCYIPSRTTFYS